MKKFVILFVILAFFISGCIPILVGTGIVTGFILSNDSAIGNIQRGYRDVWDACLEVLETQEAEIIEANESKGRIKAKILDFNLTLRIDTITKDTQRLKVAARKYLLPQPQYAQQIFFKIVKSLEW
jgi:hypothetical protein